MASSYQRIDAGQGDWLTPLNTMLEAYGDATEDSGWVDIPLTNGFVSQGTRIRSVGKLVSLQLYATNLTVGTVAGYIPQNLVIPGGFDTIIRTSGGAPFGLTIRPDGAIYVESSVTKETDIKDYISGLLFWFLN